MRLFILFLFFGAFSFGQSLTGTRGLIKAPSARMYENNTLAIGAAYIPSGIFKRTYGKYRGLVTGNAGLNTFVTVNLLPFAEIMFRYSHEFNMNVTPVTGYFPDRMLTARFKVLNESKNVPAVVLGFQDVTAAFDISCENCANYSSNYIVASKLFHLKRGYMIDFSLGFGTSLRNLKAKEFKGLFGGVEVFSPLSKDFSFLMDYDADYFNLGVNGYLFKRVHFSLGLTDFSKYTWLIAYRYQI